MGAGGRELSSLGCVSRGGMPTDQESCHRLTVPGGRQQTSRALSCTQVSERTAALEVAAGPRPQPCPLCPQTHGFS